jgi:hypothetical protein
MKVARKIKTDKGLGGWLGPAIDVDPIKLAKQFHPVVYVAPRPDPLICKQQFDSCQHCAWT